MSKILYISSEAFPLIKTGGLGDVAGSLPRALQKNNQDVRLLLPAYREILDKVKKQKCIAEISHYDRTIRLLETVLPGTTVKTWLVDCPEAFDRAGNPYLDKDNKPWADNAFRFALFAQVAVDIALDRCELNWQPDLIHCNDWQSALVPALLKTHAQRPATLFTIHNLAYQGLFSSETFDELKLPAELWGIDGLEFHDQLSFIKGGLIFADRISTVSPTYAVEIQHKKFGCGLDGLLAHRKSHLSGITNGIDTDVWNPGTDKHLIQNYNRRNLSGKANNKSQLQRQMKIPVNKKIPVLGMVSRLVEQKGLDSILSAMKDLLSLPLQIVILGSGQEKYETELLKWSEKHPEKLSVTVGYDENLSHQIEAGADMFLMPSIFEPCGLNQLYSLRYATLPVASHVGGLADTVVDTNESTIEDETANGFIVEDDTADALTETIKKALSYYENQTIWKQLQQNAMLPDRSWQSSAELYIELYEQAISDNHR